MLIQYTIFRALQYLKNEISRYEKELNAEKDPGRQVEIEGIIEWDFERALALLQFTKPGEIEQNLIDWFLNRKEIERPDLTKAKKLLNNKYQDKRKKKI
ncbi:hypothetical protein KAW50_03515 [candidate division WOR-3 bacterium]|nr:hypothetical protein [candidate division WOR-3 bacterium]